jgi:hypothetical protein
MLLTGVDLGGDYQRGTPTVHGVDLLFTADGITVQGPEPGAERLMAWSGLDSASCRARARQGDGTTAMVLILQSGSQTVQFFLPADQVTPGQAVYLDQALPLWLARYGRASAGAPSPSGGDVPPPGPSSPTTPADSPPTTPIPPTASIPPTPATTPTATMLTTPALPTPPVGPVPPFAPPPPGTPMRPVEAAPPPADSRPFFRRRSTLFVAIGIVVAALIGGGIYLGVNSSGNAAVSPTTTTRPSPPSADQQLVNSINLRLSDLPAGWAPVPPAGSSLTPAQKRAQTKVVDQLAGCLGMPKAFIGGLFGSLPQTDQVAAGDSPTFATAASASSPATIAGSHTTVVKTTADATADAAPFNKPNFTTCFSQFQNGSAGVQVKGGTAQTSEFVLFAPTGVSTFAYTTTTTLPGQGTILAENIFMIGGRSETGLTFQTAGTAVSSDAVDSAYTAMVQRIAGAGRT